MFTTDKPESLYSQRKERQLQEELKRSQRERAIIRQKIMLLPDDVQNYMGLISNFNLLFSLSGLDITNSAENINKDYPIATQLMRSINNNFIIPEEDKLKLYKNLRKFVELERKMVKMNFLDYDKDYHHLLFWGKDYLKMNGIDILYTLYLMLESHLQTNIDELDGIFEPNKTKLFLPNMTFTAEESGFTDINFEIKTVGNLNMIIKHH